MKPEPTTPPSTVIVRKLRQVLLIDDSKSDNYLHIRRIKKIGLTDDIVTRENGKEGIDYLVTPDEAGEFPRPELIFLDINMPVMNGWEFLEQYEQLAEDLKARVVLAMLTTSVAARDRKRAAESDFIAKYTEKPLTEVLIMEIMHEHFPENLGAG